MNHEGHEGYEEHEKQFGLVRDLREYRVLRGLDG
jgi:hypothetical protein